MTVWLAEQGTAVHDPLIEDFAPFEPDLVSYRCAVSELVAEVAQCTSSDNAYAEQILSRRLGDDEFATVLEAAPDGKDHTIARLLFDVRNHEPSSRNATGNLAALVRISMLAQIDSLWWGHMPAYQRDCDVLDSDDLVDLDDLEIAGELSFRYRHQADTLLTRAARSAERRTLPGRSPRTAGMWLPMARPQTISWLNEVADEFATIAPDGTPPMWVTSLARSVKHQRHLRSLGYIALVPSSHCVGYAADIEIAWYRRFRAHRLLRGLLLDRQRAGEVNVIDEGQAWHVCLHPSLAGGSPPEVNLVPADS